jgi:hypothetical protein
MSKVFEDYFSEHQTDMVSIALEYVDDRADEIFIYGASEDGTSAFDVFYKINGQLVKKEEINKTLEPGELKFDDSDDRQSAMLNIGLDNLDGIEDKCREFGQPMPTEMRLHYDVKRRKSRTKCRYDHVFTDTLELLPGDVFDAWFQSVSKGEPAL